VNTNPFRCDSNKHDTRLGAELIHDMPKRFEDHINSLPNDRMVIIRHLFFVILENLREGFVPDVQYGMISFVVPKELYAPGYHVDPSLPLPFMAIASQKRYVSLYHMGLYVKPELYAWFEGELVKQGLRPDIGKSCIRFNPAKDLPYALIGELCTKMTAQEWIATYKSTVRR